MRFSSFNPTLPDSLPPWCPSGAALDVQVPEPPRRADGKIDWHRISDEFLASILKKISRSELAAAWKITRGGIFQQIKKRKARRGLAVVAGEEMFGARPRQYKRPSKLTLLVLLWTMPATHIAKRIGCSQATILGWAKEDGLKGPGHRYWQRKKSGIKVQVPAAIIALYVKLRAEASSEEKLGEIPEVFRTSESETTDGADKPAVMADNCENAAALAEVSKLERTTEIPKLNRKGRQRVILKISKADLLEQRWLKPATRVAEDLHLSHSALLQKCRDWGLGPFLPPEEFWRSRKSGDPIIIPQEIQRILAQLRAASSGDCQEMIVVIGEQRAANVIDAIQHKGLPAISAVEPPANGDNLECQVIRFPGPRRPDPPSRALNSCVGGGTYARGAPHGRHGWRADLMNVPFAAPHLSVRCKRRLCVAARGSPSRRGEPEGFDPIIYSGFTELSDHYYPLLPAHCRGP